MAALATLLLAGCETTAEMASRAPDRTYRSDKPRPAVAECLANRLSTPEVRPAQTVAETSTTIRFTQTWGLARKPVLYIFTVSDAPGGSSLVEARTMHTLGNLDLSTAESCF